MFKYVSLDKRCEKIKVTSEIEEIQPLTFFCNVLSAFNVLSAPLLIVI